ncbi:spore germination protein KC [Paenibacillus endophyticus]|uniref:Spore germination protein KC n=1 Tax=Paenibacillus endophyticus TaxID=1294268 RepID=A0A7W5C7P6_9BACL|nr:Ger(x)C family spore germination protein [Paenibacillus endophyticus]MBB3152527.1 spore germination protein KC [Paenibacillus endophyticus]
MLHKAMMVLLCMLLLTGCWSRRELNDLLIVLGVAVDWEDGEYLVSFQVVNPSEISAQRRGGDRPPSTLYQGRGKTMFEAARSVTAEAPRKVYIGHLQIFVISESLARRGIRNFLDNTLRDNEARMDFNVVVAKGTKAEDILKIYTPLEKLPTQNMLRSLETSEKSWAPTVSVTMDDILNALSDDGKELALTGIQILGSQKKAESKENVETFLPHGHFRYMGIAAFKKDKLVGWLNERESKGYTDITNKLDSTSVELRCDERNYMGIEISSSESRIKMNVQDSVPIAHIYFQTEANIVDRSCKDENLTDPAVIKKLEQQVAKVIQGNADASVKRAKKLKADIFGLGSALGRQHPEQWKSMRQSWGDKGFQAVKLYYHIDVNIRKTGTIGNSTMK